MNDADVMLEHVPVLAGQVLDVMTPDRKAERMIDGTLGNGGHSTLFLRKYPALQLLGIDRDAEALKRAAVNLAFAADRVHAVHGRFSEMAALAAGRGWQDGVDLILLDVGVSSPQLDDPRRGFSWRGNGPLDMRMDRSEECTASRILNLADEAELERIFREYGEIRGAGRLARAVVEQRGVKPFVTTADAADLADRVLGGHHGRGGRSLPAPTLMFQALRIRVNDELEELRRALESACALLRPGGVVGVISFHSLEDRIVKHYFRRESAGCLCPPGLPVCVCGHQPSLEILTPHALTADAEEISANRRSACAKLRVARKLAVNNKEK